MVSYGCKEEASLDKDSDELVVVELLATWVILPEIVTLSVIEDTSIVIDLLSDTTDCDVTGADLVVGNGSIEVDGLYVLSGVSVALNTVDVVVVSATLTEVVSKEATGFVLLEAFAATSAKFGVVSLLMV